MPTALDAALDAQGYSYTLSRLYFRAPFSILGFDLKDLDVELLHPWPLVLAFGSVAAYITLIALWPRRRVCGGGKLHGVAHHAALFFYSLIACSAVFYHLIVSGEIASFSDFACKPTPAWLRLLSLTFNVSKIWEWGDTLVMLENGQSLKKIGILHLYHHCTTFLLMLCVCDFAGTEKGGMLLNGFVHTIMYYHFAWRLPKILRPVITAAQIVQLAYLTWLWHVTPSTCAAYATFPQEHPVEFIIPYGLVPVYLAFFLQFFWASYIAKGGRAAVKGAKKE